MKIRNGFVSNSSSSSFTCAICGCTESGMDLGLDDFGMCETWNGDIICDTHVDKFVKNLKLEDEFWDYQEDNIDWRYELDKKFCPLFHLENITKEYLLKFLLKETNQSASDVEQKIRSQFKNLLELKDYLT